MGRTVNLAKVRAARARIEAILTEHPEVRERTAALFAADPTAPELTALEEPVTKQAVSVKLDTGALARADALIPALAADPILGSVVRASRAEVIRLALAEGLAVLEARYKPAKGKTR